MTRRIQEWFRCDWCGVETDDFVRGIESWVSVRPSSPLGLMPSSHIDELCAACGAAYELAVDEARQKARTKAVRLP